MYVPIVGTNWATMPVHTPSASHEGMPMSRNTSALVEPLIAARTTRADT